MQVTRPEIPVWCFFFTCKYFFKISSKEIAVRILGKLRMWIILGMTKEKELPAHLIITTIRHGFMPLPPLPELPVTTVQISLLNSKFKKYNFLNSF